MEPPNSRRRRPALSCIECRRRKIKCDRNDPCTHCVIAKSQCTYKIYGDEHAARQQVNHGSPQAASSSTTIQAPSLSSERPQNARNTTSQVTGSTTAAPRRSNDRAPDDIQSAEPAPRDLSQRVQRLEDSLASRDPREPFEQAPSLLALQSELQDSQVGLNKTRVIKWSNWRSTTQEFATILACYTDYSNYGKGGSFLDPEIEALASQICDLLSKCKTLARTLKLGRPSRCLSCPDFKLTPPSREVADAMVILYFQTFESTHRILHVPTFWTEYQRFWIHPKGAPTNLSLKIHLVMAIASSLQDPGTTSIDLRHLVHQWVYVAQTWLSGPLEKDRLDVTGLQIHCLTMLARQVLSIGGDLMWMSMGSLVHRAMQMGLHRDPKHLPRMSVLQAEIRRRLWATILEMVVQSSLDSGMPPRIALDEFDTEEPSNINDNEVDESAVALRSHPKGVYTTSSIQLLLLKSLPTRLRVVQLLNGLRSELSYLDVLTLSSEVVDACRLCSDFVKEHRESGLTPFQRNLLDYLIRRFLFPLHLPFASEARINPLFYYSRKIGLDTAMAVVSPEPDEAFSNLMAVGGSLFKEGIRNASTTVSLELLGQTESQRLDGSLRYNSHYRELLKKAMNDITALSLERVRRGETNVKGHMFLRMIMAQVEATEAGVSCEAKIAQSARDSLELCHDLIRQQVEQESLVFTGEADLGSGNFEGGQDNYDLDLDLDFFLPDSGFS